MLACCRASDYLYKMITLFFTGTESDMQAAIEVELDTFNARFQALGNEPLIRSERALLRTFLISALSAKEETSAPKD